MVDLLSSDLCRFSYRDWLSHFTRNDQERLKIDFSEEKELSAQARALIFPSIRAFQKGEGSDGRFLRTAVSSFCKKHDLSDYEKAMDLFIREENWHSSYLKQYMAYHKIAELPHSFLDRVFRRLRRLGGLRCEVIVLVTAEMIALTYYSALERCTDSKALKSICGQMLQDEVPHAIFQSYTLSRFRNGFPARLFRWLLMEFTCLGVWSAFHKVYQKGGYTFSGFFKENQGYLRQSILLAEKNEK